MFKTLIENGISILLRDPKDERNLSVDIVNLDVLVAITEIWKMCCWIHDEFVADCVKMTFDKNGIPSFDPGLPNRNISRIISYSIHVCLIEGMLNRLYSNIALELKEYIGVKLCIDSNALEMRKNETKIVRRFRNKVAAHSIYSKPEKGDNISDELTSLSFFHSHGWTNRDPLSFSIGGLKQIAVGITPKSTNFVIGLRKTHEEMVVHFQEWVKMFSKLMHTVTGKLPIKNAPYYTKKPRKKYLLSVFLD